MSHPFICPNCGHRTSELDRNLGFTRQRKGCGKCGFAFLFELLDDYFPAPDAAFFVCDGEGRVTGCGKNSFAFTGLEEEDVIGRPVAEVLGLDRLDRRILEAICTKFGGGPVGLSTLAVAVGEEQDTIEDVYEPYLLQQGLIKRTPRGRAATAGAFEHLGLERPDPGQALF